MKIRLFLIALTGTLLFIGSASWSHEQTALKRLSEVMDSEASETMTVYGLDRCTALFYGSAKQLRTRGTEFEDTAASFEATAVQLGQIGLLVRHYYGFEVDPEKIANRILDIQGLYEERLYQNLLATGHTLGPLIKDDLAYCKTFSESIEKLVQ